jgi:Sulfatase-modifying factor enzyme 1
MKTLFLLFVFALVCHAHALPTEINFQGVLVDQQGNPINGIRAIQIKLYDAASGGNSLYFKEIGNTEVKDGIYSFKFGADTPDFSSALSSQSLFLAVFVNGIEQSPRSQILAVPYAMKSKVSETSQDAQEIAKILFEAGIVNLDAVKPTYIKVDGGTIPSWLLNTEAVISSFWISKYEVTWAEWKEVRDWAAANGYDLGGVGEGSNSHHPVRAVSWYDAVKWCNAKSVKEGFMPVYYLGEDVYKSGQDIPSVKAEANGYRLPFQAEWIWAASGGLLRDQYSIGNNKAPFAWYNENSAGGPKAVGTKAPNPLGIYDMLGNVYEWCLEAPLNSSQQPVRGGSWNESASAASFLYNYSRSFIATLRSMDIGLRPVRSFQN